MLRAINIIIPSKNVPYCQPLQILLPTVVYISDQWVKGRAWSHAFLEVLTCKNVYGVKVASTWCAHRQPASYRPLIHYVHTNIQEDKTTCTIPTWRVLPNSDIVCQCMVLDVKQVLSSYTSFMHMQPFPSVWRPLQTPTWTRFSEVCIMLCQVCLPKWFFLQHIINTCTLKMLVKCPFAMITVAV